MMKVEREQALSHHDSCSKRTPILSVVAFLAASSISGSAFLFTKYAKHDFPPFMIAALRLCIGSVLLTLVNIFVYFFYNSTSSSYLLEDRPRHYFLGSFFVLGLLNCVIPYVIYPIALNNLNVGVTATLAASSPLFAQLFAFFLIDSERNVGGRRWFGLVIGFLGVFVISIEKVVHEKGFDWSYMYGYIICIIAASSKAMASVYVHRFLPTLPILKIALGQTAAGAFLAIIATLSIEYVYPPSHFASHFAFFNNVTLRGALAIGYLGLFGSCIVYVLEFFLVRYQGSVRQIMVNFLVPAISMAEGALILGEWDNLSGGYIAFQVVGACMIVLGIVLAMRGGSAAPAPSTSSGYLSPLRASHRQSDDDDVISNVVRVDDTRLLLPYAHSMQNESEPSFLSDLSAFRRSPEVIYDEPRSKLAPSIKGDL
eukprot:TRINITY_DN4975_c0_g1_i1.p1 TRINITY_DN4975_c0_g1~~TRINITY_DN4975_c0_g1_i1.p1  ORF type:complete len:427 (+),score=66.95 TRINITY_DN4975_c0_g1_i1:86-1366(+)